MINAKNVPIKISCCWYNDDVASVSNVNRLDLQKIIRNDLLLYKLHILFMRNAMA